MPSKSHAQLKLMRMALAFKRGKLKRAPKKIKRVAKSMTIKELEDFVHTPKAEELPDHVNEDFATLGGTPGMGDVAAPTATSTGSGDTFTSFGLFTQHFLKKAKKDRKRGKANPMKQYKPKKGKVAFQPFGTVSYFHDFIKDLQSRNSNEFGDHNDDNQGSILGNGESVGGDIAIDGGGGE